MGTNPLFFNPNTCYCLEDYVMQKALAKILQSYRFRKERVKHIVDYQKIEAFFYLNTIQIILLTQTEFKSGYSWDLWHDLKNDWVTTIRNYTSFEGHVDITCINKELSFDVMISTFRYKRNQFDQNFTSKELLDYSNGVLYISE